MPPAAESPLPLEYAPAAARAPAGGLLFKPSLRSLLLLALTALAILWLARRHTPWRFVAEIHANHRYADHPFISPDNRLFACDTQDGVRWIDLTTGRPAAVFPTFVRGAHYFPTSDGQRIIVHTPTSPTIDFHDANTGALLAQRPNPNTLGYTGSLFSADGTRLFTRALPPRVTRPADRSVRTTRPTIAPVGAGPNALVVWDLAPTAPSAQSKTVSRIDATRIRMIGRGTRLLMPDEFGALSVLDANDLHTIFARGDMDGWRIPRLDPTLDHLPLIKPPGVGYNTISYALHSLTDGALLDSGTITAPRSDISWSPDASVRAVRTWTTSSAGTLSLSTTAPPAAS
jgi:hypothetical protein